MAMPTSSLAETAVNLVQEAHLAGQLTETMREDIYGELKQGHHQRVIAMIHELQVQKALEQEAAQQPFTKARVRGRKPTLEDKLAMRMDWDFLPQNIDVMPGTSKIFVAVVKDDQGTMLEDGRDLFPSDQLITQLRMVLA